MLLAPLAHVALLCCLSSLMMGLGTAVVAKQAPKGDVKDYLEKGGISGKVAKALERALQNAPPTVAEEHPQQASFRPNQVKDIVGAGGISDKVAKALERALQNSPARKDQPAKPAAAPAAESKPDDAAAEAKHRAKEEEYKRQLAHLLFTENLAAYRKEVEEVTRALLATAAAERAAAIRQNADEAVDALKKEVRHAERVLGSHGNLKEEALMEKMHGVFLERNASRAAAERAAGRLAHALANCRSKQADARASKHRADAAKQIEEENGKRFAAGGQALERYHESVADRVQMAVIEHEKKEKDAQVVCIQAEEAQGKAQAAARLWRELEDSRNWTVMEQQAAKLGNVFQLKAEVLQRKAELQAAQSTRGLAIDQDRLAKARAKVWKKVVETEHKAEVTMRKALETAAQTAESTPAKTEKAESPKAKEKEAPRNDLAAAPQCGEWPREHKYGCSERPAGNWTKLADASQQAACRDLCMKQVGRARELCCYITSESSCWMKPDARQVEFGAGGGVSITCGDSS